MGGIGEGSGGCVCGGYKEIRGGGSGMGGMGRLGSDGIEWGLKNVGMEGTL